MRKLILIYSIKIGKYSLKINLIVHIKYSIIKCQKFLIPNAPDAKRSINHKYLKREQWVNKDLMNSKPAYQVTKAYRIHLKIYNETKRKAKTTFIRDQLFWYENNISKIWQVINKVLGKPKDKS